MADPASALQAALNVGGQALDPSLMGTPHNAAPNVPPQQTTPTPDVNLGTDTSPQTGMGGSAPPISGMQPAPQAQQPPKMGGAPLLARFLTQMFGGQNARGYAPAEPGQPGRPVSRLDAFEGFVGQFLDAFSQGMAASGHGPGANIRGAAAAMQGPYNRQLQQYQLGQQQQVQQAQIAQEQARTEQTQAQTRMMGEMVTIQTPYGPQTMPYAIAQKAYPAAIQAQGRITAAGVKRYASSPFGIFDTQTGKYATADKGAGTIGATIKMTQEMADSGQYGQGAQQLVGSQVKISDLENMQRTQQGGFTMVQGAAGPAREAKVGPIGSLGLGSPAANTIATAKLQLQRATFERDTFGEWVSTDLANKYPSLVSISNDGQTLGWKSPVAPTATIKTQAQQAQDLQSVIGDIKKDITAAQKAGLLGPFEGRWNEFMVGSVGGDNPQFAKLRSEMSFLASGGLKAHFGARGGTAMYEHFINQFDSGKMGAADLIAGIEGMQTFFKTYAGRMQTTGGGGANKPAKPGAGKKIAFTEIPGG